MPFGAQNAKNTALDAIWGNLHYTGVPDEFWIALLTTMPTGLLGVNGFSTAVEVSGGSYSRLHILNNGTNFPAASGGSKSNGVDMETGIASASWGTLKGFALMTHATNSANTDCYYFDVLLADTPVPSGSSFLFPAGTMVFKFAGGA